MTKNRQLGKEAGQVGDPRTFPPRGVQGKRQVTSLSQNSLDQTGQTGAGANLHKGMDSGGMERLDLSHELHRLGQLSGEK